MAGPTNHPYIWVPDAPVKTWLIDDLRPSMISIKSIAKGLSKECRFAGQIEGFYSVAQHSVIMRSVIPLPPHLRIYALLHDAAEGYIGDQAKPIKVTLPDFNDLEEKVQAVIHHAFGMAYPMPEIIKEYDARMVVTEAEQMFAEQPDWLQDFYDAGIFGIPGVYIYQWDWEQAYRTFMDCFNVDFLNYCRFRGSLDYSEVKYERH